MFKKCFVALYLGKIIINTRITYIKSNMFEGRRGGKNKMKKYECTVCGYVYDPELGDPENGVAPGTSFEDVPDDWVCPECGVEKDLFEALD